jgi:hypothetical protein
MAQLRHAFAVSDGGNTRAAVLGDALPRQVAFRNPKRVALGIFPVTSGAAVFWGFSDAVRPADNDGLMPGIPVPSTGLWVYGWQYLGPVWIVGAGNSSWPLDVRIVEHSACDPKILTGG